MVQLLLTAVTLLPVFIIFLLPPLGIALRTAQVSPSMFGLLGGGHSDGGWNRPWERQ
jgi:hypothetical protein